MNAGHISAVGMNVIPSWRSQPLPELLSFPHAVNKLANPSRSTFFFFFKDSESWSKMVSLRELWGMTQELPTLVLKNVYPISLAHSLFILAHFLSIYHILAFLCLYSNFLNQFLSAESVLATVEMVFVGRTRVFGASSAPFMLLSSYGYSLSDPAFPLEFVSVTVISCILEALW